MKQIIITILILFSITAVHSQGLPPGWDYTYTGTSHNISIPLATNPVIDGIPIAQGDYIGVFYFRDGVQYCGGAYPWDGNEPIGILPCGDDYFTTLKDGFSTGEKFNWRIYSWSQERNYEADVIYDFAFPNDSLFSPDGFTKMLDISVNSLSVTLSTAEDTICDGQSTQLIADPTGGSGGYFYTWTSFPPGIVS